MSAPAVMTPSANVHEFTTDLIVCRRSTPADGVVVLDLAHPEHQALPRWEPGAHIDLVLGDGLIRQYSLCGNPHDSGVWRVGVLLDPNGRGGSQYVHDNLAEGTTVRVRGPRNHFPLVDAPQYRFIAGGIGITPILGMLEAVQRAGNDWTLVYGRRTNGDFSTSNRFSKIPRPIPWSTAVGPRDCCRRSSRNAANGRQGYFISNGSPQRHLPKSRPLKRSIALTWCANVPG